MRTEHVTKKKIYKIPWLLQHFYKNKFNSMLFLVYVFGLNPFRWCVFGTKLPKKDISKFCICAHFYQMEKTSKKKTTKNISQFLWFFITFISMLTTNVIYHAYASFYLLPFWPLSFVVVVFFFPFLKCSNIYRAFGTINSIDWIDDSAHTYLNSITNRKNDIVNHKIHHKKNSQYFFFFVIDRQKTESN